jgi:hypothetical protein
MTADRSVVDHFSRATGEGGSLVAFSFLPQGSSVLISFFVRFRALAFAVLLIDA